MYKSKISGVYANGGGYNAARQKKAKNRRSAIVGQENCRFVKNTLHSIS